MNVKIVSITQPLVEGQSLTAEELIVYTARVSNPSNQLNTETSDKLIAYLIRHKHWSPLEQADLGVEVKTSRAIAAQILRHWSLSVQEFSQRYAEATEYEPVQLRRKAEKNRQSSEEVFDPEIISPLTGAVIKASMAVENCVEYCDTLYKRLLEADVAKECARMILPLTTQTTMYLKGSIRDWVHYLLQRTAVHAQLEHRQVVEAIEKIFAQHFPNVYKAVQISEFKPR